MRRIEIPGSFFPVHPADKTEDLALEVMCLLYDEPWVRLHFGDLVTQWTVLERDKNGIPVRIGSEEFDGTCKVLDHG